MPSGNICWTDLTVDNADEIRKFYENVLGLTSREHPMSEEYCDYDMLAGDDTVTGICHRRGPNANVPPVWMVYFAVDDVQKSAEQCLQSGGKILDGPRKMGAGDFAVIQDPAGAICALFKG